MRAISVAIISIFILSLMPLAFAQDSTADAQQRANLFVSKLNVNHYQEVKGRSISNMLQAFLFTALFATVFFLITEGIAKLINRTKKNTLTWKRALFSRLVFPLFFLLLFIYLISLPDHGGFYIFIPIAFSPMVVLSPLYTLLATYLEYRYIDIKYKKLGPLIAIIITALITSIIGTFFW